MSDIFVGNYCLENFEKNYDQVMLYGSYLVNLSNFIE